MSEEYKLKSPNGSKVTVKSKDRANVLVKRGYKPLNAESKSGSTSGQQSQSTSEGSE